MAFQWRKLTFVSNLIEHFIVFYDLAQCDLGSIVLNIPEHLRERMLEILHKGPARIYAETNNLTR